MSAEQDHVRALAYRIAQRVSQAENGQAQTEPGPGHNTGDELASVRQSLDEMKRKLAALEEQLLKERNDSDRTDGGETADGSSRPRSAAPPPTSARSPWLSGIYVPATHPSQERFGVEEAAVSELVDYFEKEKVCELEPGGKPCDHCAMCSTRGF
jgi:hypothetical protein